MNERRYNILYVDDELNNLKTFKATFKWDYNIFLAQSGDEGIKVLNEEDIQLIISDQRMPEMTGCEFLEIAKEKHPGCIRMILTAYSDMDLLMKAINKCGIHQFLTKPWKENEIKHVIDSGLETYQLRKDNKQLIKDLHEANEKLKNENIYLKEEIRQEHDFDNILTESDNFKKVLNRTEKVANTKSTVLIRGESGTGKELLARAIHSISNRSQYPLVKVNCAALPAELIESELFGHEKGAFTGAHSARKGRFELANKGTIFLDEIGELPLNLQTKLLRVLQESEFEKLGSEKTMKIDVRVIAATNRNLEEAIHRKEFREDLFYRLNVFPLNCPPLRERREDIPLLANHFVNKYEQIVGKKIDKIPSKVLKQLTDYNWPGNIRELENLIQRSMITSSTAELSIGDEWAHTPQVTETNTMSMEDIERNHIIKVLEISNWKVSGKGGAAEKLQLNPKTLFSRMEKLSISKS